MDIQQVIDALKEKRVRLDRALAVLEHNSRAPTVRSRRAVSGGSPSGRRHMSRQARARIAAAQRRRWAKVKAKQSTASGSTAKKK